jgi:hypothetical protein
MKVCPIRRDLEIGLLAAINTLYGFESASAAAPDDQALRACLAMAMESERMAVEALEAHKREHAC